MVHEVDPRVVLTLRREPHHQARGRSPDGERRRSTPAATMFEGQTLLLMRVEDRTGLSRLVVATSDDGFTDWKIDAERGRSCRTSIASRNSGASRTPGSRRIDDGVYLHRLHGVLAGRTAGLPRDDGRLRTFDEARRDPVSRGQGRGAVPADVRRPVGRCIAPSGATRSRARCPRLAVVEPGPPLLGRRADRAPRAARRMVGREQGRHGAAAAPHRCGDGCSAITVSA